MNRIFRPYCARDKTSLSHHPPDTADQKIEGQLNIVEKKRVVLLFVRHPAACGVGGLWSDMEWEAVGVLLQVFEWGVMFAAATATTGAIES